MRELVPGEVGWLVDVIKTHGKVQCTTLEFGPNLSCQNYFSFLALAFPTMNDKAVLILIVNS